MYAAHIDWSHPLYFTVDDVLSAAECDAMIARIETSSPKLATINAPEGVVEDTRIRNNTRVMFDDHAFAQVLFGRVVGHVPREMMGLSVAGANERLRCYRYGPGQRFAPHYDGSFMRSAEEQSLLTLMVYLNDGFTGGETAFVELDHVVQPRRGTALLFQHPILHEGCVVTEGVKYALRSDVMYRRQRDAGAASSP